MYFWTPHWAQEKYDLTMVQLPEVTPECEQAAADGTDAYACAYPQDDLYKAFNQDLQTKAPAAFAFLSAMSWTNDDQNVVALGDQRRAGPGRCGAGVDRPEPGRVAALGRRRSRSAVRRRVDPGAGGRAAEGRPGPRGRLPRTSTLRVPAPRRRCGSRNADVASSNTVRHHLERGCSAHPCPDRDRRRRHRRRAAAYHLAELGVTDVLVLDQGPLFADRRLAPRTRRASSSRRTARARCAGSRRTPSRSTTRSRSTARRSGTASAGSRSRPPPERMEELKRRQGFARSYGIEGTELLSPAECAERSPLLDPSTVLGGYWVPSDGAGKGVQIVEALARAGRGGRRRLRGRRHRHRVRHDRRADPRGRDRAGPCRVRARAPVRRHLGPDGRRDGRRADPAGRRPAPTGLDRPDPGAGGARLARAAGRASPGHVAVLPPARRPFRRRQLPARADRDAAVASSARRVARCSPR